MSDNMNENENINNEELNQELIEDTRDVNIENAEANTAVDGNEEAESNAESIVKEFESVEENVDMNESTEESGEDNGDLSAEDNSYSESVNEGVSIEAEDSTDTSDNESTEEVESSENSDSSEKPAKPKKAKPEEPLIELTEEEKKKIFANTEAILFALGNSVQISKLCEVFEINERSLIPVLEEMQKKYDDEERGIEMIFLEGSVQLGTKKETYECLTKIAKIPAKYTLTDTVLETLSIIAYKQPVTRAEIEKIRGVSCDHAISKLIEFDLIEDVGRLEAPGHPLLFGTTEQFLRSFGVKSIGDLPAISPELVEDFKHQAENEAYGKPEGEEGDDTDSLIGDGDVNPEDEPPTIVEV